MHNTFERKGIPAMLWGAIFLVSAAMLVVYDIYRISDRPEPQHVAASVGEVINHLRNSYPGDKELPSEEEMYRIAIDAILKEVGDKHGAFLPTNDYKSLRDSINPSHYGGMNISVSKYENIVGGFEILIMQIFDGSPLPNFGVRAGDTITHVNGTVVTGENWYDMLRSIRGPIGSDVTLTIKRDGERQLGAITFQRAKAKRQSIFAKHNQCFLHLKLTSFPSRPAEEVLRVIRQPMIECGGGFKGLVLDVRGNPGGSLTGAVSVSDMFLDKQDVIFKAVGKTATNNTTVVSRVDSMFPKSMPVVALIDGNSASASEIVVGALKVNRSLFAILGTKSYGKGSIQTIFPMHDGSTAVKITTARYLAGGHVEIDGVGIHPNLVVEQPEPPGIHELHEKVNKELILYSMNPQIDHQLRVAFDLLEFLSKDADQVARPLFTVVKGIKAIEDEQPIPITPVLCNNAGLRGCPNPGSVPRNTRNGHR